MDTQNEKIGIVKKAGMDSLIIEPVMRDLLREGSHLDQDIVYKTLSERLPLEEIKAKVREDYPVNNDGAGMIQRLTEALGPKYVPLLLEPSLSSRVDAFLEFASSRKRLSPW